MKYSSPRRRGGRLILAALALAAGAGLAACTPGSGAPGPEASGTPTANAPSQGTSPGTDPSGGPTDTATPDETLPSALPSGAVMNGVAPGFPTDLIPEYPGSSTKSSVDTVHDGARDVSLSGQTADAPEKVQSFYAEAMKKNGFKELTSKESGAVRSVTFSRGDGKEFLTVTTAGSDGQVVFTVGGQLAP